jgi:hypothetical protein
VAPKTQIAYKNVLHWNDSPVFQLCGQTKRVWAGRCGTIKRHLDYTTHAPLGVGRTGRSNAILTAGSLCLPCILAAHGRAR